MLKLMYITNKPEVAKIAEQAGVDRIFVDLETIGKSERQGGMDTVQSHHTLNDVRIIKNSLEKSKLLVRSNPIYHKSKEEIDTIIKNGADIVMLPFFKTVNEAAKFIDLVHGRAKVCLLVETAEAVEKLDAILALDGIDEIHIGLNDLHLAYGMKFMFELLADGTVEKLADKIKARGIPFGFGGIAQIGVGDLPAEYIIKEHYRLESSMVIVSRSFCNTDNIKDIEEIRSIFNTGIQAIRELEKEADLRVQYFKMNQKAVVDSVSSIVDK